MKQVKTYICALPLTVKQAVKYGVVGAINTLTNFIAFESLIAVGINIVLSNLAGYIVGLIGSFIMNRKWTFKSNGPVKKESFLFVIIFGVCYLIQLGVLLLLNSQLNMHHSLSQIIAIGTFSVCNFSFNKIFTFNKV